MHLEHPRLGRLLARAVGMLDSKLRLAFSAVSMHVMLVEHVSAYPTPPRPTSAAHIWSTWSSVVPRSTKSASRAKGTTMSGGCGVSSRSEVGHLLVLACLDPLCCGAKGQPSAPLNRSYFNRHTLCPRAVSQLTECLVKRSIHVIFNDAGLEASICVAKRYVGGHDTLVVALKQWCLRLSAC
jgi:hypothetical protein